MDKSKQSSVGVTSPWTYRGCGRRQGIMVVFVVTVTCALMFMFISTRSLVWLDVWGKLSSYSALTAIRSSVRETHFTSSEDSLEQIYYRRLTKAMDSCFGNQLGQVEKIIRDNKMRLANCIVPKVGCTYWINIIRYLNNNLGGNKYASPFEIPRWFTHFGTSMKTFSVLPNGPGQRFLNSTLRFMFVREPYSRLWSAWIDKFWLPDFWGNVDANRIMRTLKLSGECHGKDITFLEFLTYLTSPTVMNKSSLLNNHWRPYKYLCDPCVFRPQVIGKMETFSQDTRYILESTNLTWMLDPPRLESEQATNSQEKHVDHSLQEIKLLTEFNIQEYEGLKQNMKDCASIEEIGLRIWKAFQYNGHVPAEEPFPSDRLEKTNFSIQSFQTIAEETYRSWKDRSKAVQSKQKKDAMVAAYRNVPMKIMKRLQILYKTDFEIYGYDKEPEELYAHRQA